MQNFTIASLQAKRLSVIILLILCLLNIYSCAKHDEVALVETEVGQTTIAQTVETQGAAKEPTNVAETAVSKAVATAEFNQQVGDVVPDFTCNTNKGKTFTLSKCDKPVFLTIWATW